MHLFVLVYKLYICFVLICAHIVIRFVYYGLDHWGSDTQGVNTTRRFLLEWLSFLHRYVPVGLLDANVQTAQKINQRPPNYVRMMHTSIY